MSCIEYEKSVFIETLIMVSSYEHTGDIGLTEKYKNTIGVCSVQGFKRVAAYKTRKKRIRGKSKGLMVRCVRRSFEIVIWAK